jgi:GDP-D-mannose 3', 5'-epimerase
MVGAMKVLVAGAGGFIGGHLLDDLISRGVASIRAVDVKPLDQWHQRFEGVETRVEDLMDIAACHRACDGVEYVYNLAADMGGMGFIENNKALCMLSSVISTNLLRAARNSTVERFFFASSACVYPAGKQDRPDVAALRESDAYPAMPEDGYGWEKLFGERMCRHFYEDFGLETRVARYHNIYGPRSTYQGGREKAPAALCRKVAIAQQSGQSEVSVWGDGRATRSFTNIGDCLEGTNRLMASDIREPLNVGSDELVTIDGLLDIIEEIAGTSLVRHYVLDAPQGVRGRNSDNTLSRKLLGWEPQTTLRSGMEELYRWIYDQVASESHPHQSRVS